MDVLSHTIVSDSLRPHGLYPTRLLCPWGFSRQEYWSGWPCPPPGHLPNSEIESRSPALQVYSLPSEPLGKPIPMAEPVQFLVKCDLIHFILHFKLSIGLWCHSDTTLSAFHSIWTLATLISPKLLLLPWKLLPGMSMWPCPSFSPSVIQILPIPFSCLMFLYSISHHLINLFSFFFVFSSFY